MCTAAAYKTRISFWKNTRLHEFSYGDEIALLPRNYVLISGIRESLKNIMQSLEWHMWQVTILFTMML